MRVESVDHGPVQHVGDDRRNQIIQENPEWVSSQDSAKDGCQVTVDYTGLLDGEPFEGGEDKDAVFVLGQGQMLADFEALNISMQSFIKKKEDLTLMSNSLSYCFSEIDNECQEPRASFCVFSAES